MRPLSVLSWTLCFLWIAAGASGQPAAVPPEPPSTAAPVYEWMMRSPEPRPGRAMVALYLPSAITPDEIERYAHILNLSEAQRAFVDALHERHLAAERDLREGELTVLMERASEAATWAGTAHLDPEAAKLRTQVYQQRNRYAQAMRALEESLFDDFIPILTDAHIERLPRVRMMRRRAFSGAVTTVAVPAGIDLASLFNELERDGIISSDAAKRDDVDAIVLAYETTMTPLRESHARAYMLALERGPALRATRDPDRIRQAQRLYIRSQTYERHMTDLNRVHAATLADMLPREERAAFLAEFNQRAFPGVYPDPHDMTCVLIAALDEAREEVEDAVRNLLDRYQDRQERLSEEMVHIALERDQIHQITGAVGGNGEQEFRSAMDSVQRRRAESAELTFDELEALLGPELTPAVVARIDAYRLRVAGDRRRYGDVRGYRPLAVNLAAEAAEVEGRRH